MEKIVYQYSDSGVFLYQTVADESPLEPGVFLFPRNTTDVRPPSDVSTDQVVVWTGTEWSKQAAPVSDPVQTLVEFFLKNPSVWKYVKDNVDG